MKKHLYIILLLFLAPSYVLAHSGHMDSGLLHPLTGWDHLLAAWAVGMSLALGKNRHAWPGGLGFLVVLGMGMTLGQIFAQAAFVEPLILASVILLGLNLYRYKNLESWFRVSLAAVFALAHGWAHGAEAAVGRYEVLAGIMLSTGLIIAAAYWLTRGMKKTLVISTGGLMMLGGLAMSFY